MSKKATKRPSLDPKDRKLTEFFSAAPEKRAKVDKLIDNEHDILEKENKPKSITDNKHINDLLQHMSDEWVAALKHLISKPSFGKLAEFVAHERAQYVIYPSPKNVFSWSNFTSIVDIKVVILGQDPYHGPNQAHGLAFSVMQPERPPPSLVNMFKEIADNCSVDKEEHASYPKHGDLTAWAEQGVLLLNAVLTVRQKSPNSHKGKGWEALTAAAVAHLADRHKNIVFMLWGAHAIKQGEKINRDRHCVLTSTHPSPLSAHRGFLGCKHFKLANEYLEKNQKTPIDWTKTFV